MYRIIILSTIALTSLIHAGQPPLSPSTFSASVYNSHALTDSLLHAGDAPKPRSPEKPRETISLTKRSLPILFLDGFASFPHLRVLNLSQNNSEELEMPRQSFPSTLTALLLNNNALQNNEVLKLTALTSLRALYLHNNQTFNNDEVALSLATCLTKLHTLTLSETDVSDQVKKEIEHILEKRRTQLSPLSLQSKALIRAADSQLPKINDAELPPAKKGWLASWWSSDSASAS